MAVDVGGMGVFVAVGVLVGVKVAVCVGVAVEEASVFVKVGVAVGSGGGSIRKLMFGVVPFSTTVIGVADVTSKTLL